MDLGLEGEDLWWYNLRTQKVEQGPGDPNSERMGPYATRAEAESALEIVDVETALRERCMRQDFLVQRRIRLDALDHHFRQCVTHARDGDIAIFPIGDQFGDQRVIVWRHAIA